MTEETKPDSPTSGSVEFDGRRRNPYRKGVYAAATLYLLFVPSLVIAYCMNCGPTALVILGAGIVLSLWWFWVMVLRFISSGLRCRQLRDATLHEAPSGDQSRGIGLSNPSERSFGRKEDDRI